MKSLKDITVLLVNFTLQRLEESSVAKVKIIRFVLVNSGLVNDAEEEYAGKKVRQICQ